MDANALKTAVGTTLDEMGAGDGLERVSKAKGHGFDESDDSYRRRLLASVIGAAAAGAESQPPADADDKLKQGEEQHAPEEPSPPAKEPEQAPPVETAPKEPALRTDGPTVEEWVMAGYSAKHYPPKGYAPRSSDDEVKAAIAAQEAAQAHIPHEGGANGEQQAGDAAAAVQPGVHGVDPAVAAEPTPLP